MLSLLSGRIWGACGREKAGIGHGMQVPAGGAKCLMEAAVRALPSRSIPASSLFPGFTASVGGLKPTI